MTVMMMMMMTVIKMNVMLIVAMTILPEICACFQYHAKLTKNNALLGWDPSIMIMIMIFATIIVIATKDNNC